MAGQSVPHVHVHLIPRHETDYEGVNDRIYPALEANEQQLNSTLEKSSTTSTSAVTTATQDTPSTSSSSVRGGGGWRIPKDEERKPRSMDEMESEAQWLGSLFT